MDIACWVTVFVAAACLSGCSRHAGAGAPSARSGPTSCLPSQDGYLRARLRGASNLDIDWHGEQLRCAGEPRPDNRGIRLTFAGRAQPGNHPLRFVFGIDAAPVPGIAHNLATNVTVIFEGERKLYSTRGAGNCTVDELRQEPIDVSAADGRLRVSARGFCIAPATAIGGGDDELLLSRFDFTGLVLTAAANK